MLDFSRIEKAFKMMSDAGDMAVGMVATLERKNDELTTRAETAEARVASLVEVCRQALRCMEYFLPPPTLEELNRGGMDQADYDEQHVIGSVKRELLSAIGGAMEDEKG